MERYIRKDSSAVSPAAAVGDARAAVGELGLTFALEDSEWVARRHA
jgi:hypothetical protein